MTEPINFTVKQEDAYQDSRETERHQELALIFLFARYRFLNPDEILHILTKEYRQ